MLLLCQARWPRSGFGDAACMPHPDITGMRLRWPAKYRGSTYVLIRSWYSPAPFPSITIRSKTPLTRAMATVK